MSSLLWAAEAALRTGAVSRARALYMDAFVAAQRPSLRAAALAGLGHTAFAAAEHREAATRFEHALSLAPDLLERDPAAADALGRAYSLLCRDRESIDLFRTRLQASERRGVVTVAYSAEETGKGGVAVEPTFTREGEAPPDRFPILMKGVVLRAGEERGEPREVEIEGSAEKFDALLDELGMIGPGVSASA